VAGYVDKVLLEDEEIVHRAAVHWVVYLGGIVWVGLAIIVFIASSSYGARLAVNVGGAPYHPLTWVGYVMLVLGAFRLMGAALEQWTTELAITTRRAIAKVGFIRRETWEINASKIESVEVDQSIFGRLLGYGTVVVKGTGGGTTPMKLIADPIAFRNHITAR
jgi:uncharacterized membrane protein YdbT with pleckstrin-like domain